MQWMAMAMVLAMVSVAVADGVASTQPAKSVLQATVLDTKGQPVALDQYRGNVLLLVNVASRCGFTPQYEQLEQVYRKYKDQGFTVLAFPANDFGAQEPGTNEEIVQFCRSKYDVTFPLFGKLVTKGDGQSSLYQFLTSKESNGQFGGQIGWNFTKFLISRDGEVVARYDSGTRPDDAKVTEAVQRELAKEKPAN